MSNAAWKGLLRIVENGGMDNDLTYSARGVGRCRKSTYSQEGD